ncbi:DUF1275 domain-containing protein [Candidatus Sumerlaeota bacterium]|nr:DUF1275 domain-containing protein [Candidatus Sumerlaeota bacterium]
MFVSQAHSFTRQTRFVLKLAAIAGYTNIVTLLTCGAVTSHVSGTASTLGHGLATAQWTEAAFAFAVVFAFFSGASMSGLMEEWARRAKRRAQYALPLTAEAALLVGLALAMEMHGQNQFEKGSLFTYVACVASFAMGLQNATITRISGGVIRTTHVTGVVTDLGLELAQIVTKIWDQWKMNPHAASDKTRMMNIHSPRRFLLLAAILGSFAAGAALGTLAYAHMQWHTMWPPVIVLIVTIAQDLRKPFVQA